MHPRKSQRTDNLCDLIDLKLLSIKVFMVKMIVFLLLLSSVLTAGADEKLHIQRRMAFAYEAGALQFPWHVSLYFWGSDNEQHYCGGSVISDWWVLTAAHCVHHEREVFLGFGSTSLHTPTVQMKSRRFKIFPAYTPLKSLYDMAMVKLPKQLDFSDIIQPVRLPTMFLDSETFEGYSAQLSGFGRTQEKGAVSGMLLWAPMKVISNDKCAEIYGRAKIFSSILCTVGQDHQKHSPCPGDSGGPLVVFEDRTNSWILIGVMAFIYQGNCTSGLPTGYMRVTFIREWIDEILKS